MRCVSRVKNRYDQSTISIPFIVRSAFWSPKRSHAKKAYSATKGLMYFQEGGILAFTQFSSPQNNDDDDKNIP